jgi:hypothetical protein
MGQNKVVRRLNRELRQKYLDEGIEPTHKYCSICGQLKEVDEFYKCNDGSKLFGIDAKCKFCNKERGRLYVKEHKEERREYSKKYNNENKELIRKTRKEYKCKNKEEISKKNAEYHQKTKKHKNDRVKMRIKTDPEFRLRRNLRCRLWTIMNRKKNQPAKDYGVNWSDCISHLGTSPEGILQPSIDHIIPCRAFDFTNPEHPALCFHPTNLRWLSEIENESKQDKIYPSLIRSHNLEWICLEIGLDLDSYVEGELLRVKKEEV